MKEVRSAARVMDLPQGAASQVGDCLKKAKLLTTQNKGGLQVTPMGNVGHLAVSLTDSIEATEEGVTPIIEEAEVVLREAGYALVLTSRQTPEGWLSPFIQIYGKSERGPGP